MNVVFIRIKKIFHASFKNNKARILMKIKNSIMGSRWLRTIYHRHRFIKNNRWVRKIKSRLIIPVEEVPSTCPLTTNSVSIYNRLYHELQEVGKNIR